MALTEELPIYRATYRLLNMLIRATQDFPRFYKYSLGTRMVDVCLDMSMLLYKANSSYEKTEPLREFLGKFGMLQMLLRVCAEQKVIDTKKVAVFALEMEKIGKQATGWKQYNEKGHNSMATDFKHLFEPIKIGNVVIPNRIGIYLIFIYDSLSVSFRA